jgi:cobalt-zinc-cadmium efflux system membrane fusion protein
LYNLKNNNIMKPNSIKFQFILSAFLCVVLWNCSSKKPQEVETKDDDSAYRLDTVQLRNYEQELQFTGQVSFDEKQVDRVYPIASGTVLEVNADLGTYVKKGQVLAKLQSTDVSNYQKDYNTAKSSYDLAKRNADNTQQLYNSKFSSESDLIASKKQLEIASAEVERSSQVVKVYGQTKSGDLPIFTVKAPESGYIVERNVNPNVQIRPDNGDAIFTISNLSDVWVLINIYESDIASVKMGQQVNIQTMAYPDKIFTGTISNIGQVLDNDSKVLKARVVLQNPDGLLKPDMFCTVKLHIQKQDKLLAVNPKGIIFNNEHYFVIRQNANNTYEKVAVEVLKTTSKYSYVKGGLKPGDRIVTEGSLLLFNELNQ